MYQGVIGFYSGLFYRLESVGILDPNNDLHLFCLHFVYLPRINRHLNSWREAWVKHPMRTEQNLSPEQLWVKGLQQIANSGSTISKEVFEFVTEVSKIIIIIIITSYYYNRTMHMDSVSITRALLPMNMILLMCQKLLAPSPS